MKVVFFVNDVGYGHQVRQSCVANELAQRGAEVTFQIGRTGFLQDILDPRVKVKQVFNLVSLSTDLFGVNILGTKHLMKDYSLQSKKWVERMSKSRHVTKSDIIVTDIVEEAGAVAKKTGKPVFAISHFTWHWFFNRLGAGFDDIVSCLNECFTADSFLYPPFSKDPQSFPNRQEIGLIVREARPRTHVRAEMNIKEDERVVVVGGSEVTAVQTGLLPNLYDLQKTGLTFLGGTGMGAPFRQVPYKARFHDYVNAADLVITKGGYSTMSECLAYGVRMLVVREKNHPESLENARLLQDAGRALVCDFEAFEENPGALILRALEDDTSQHPLKRDGQKQACDLLFEALK